MGIGPNGPAARTNWPSRGRSSCIGEGDEDVEGRLSDGRIAAVQEHLGPPPAGHGVDQSEGSESARGNGRIASADQCLQSVAGVCGTILDQATDGGEGRGRVGG
jgi:hypothetical protein